MSANNRTRVISQSKAVYVAPTGWTLPSSHKTVEAAQLHGVDTFSFEMDLAGSRQDVREFGQLARIGTVRMSEINPTLSFGYYLQDGANELALGFTEGNNQCIHAMLTEDAAKRESNVFVLAAKEGDDAFGYANVAAFDSAKGDHDVIGFGNAFVSSYSVNMSVGEIPRADIEMQASNVVFYNDIHSGIIPPSLNLDGTRSRPHASANIGLPKPTVCDNLGNGLKVLKPHDVTIEFTHTDGAKPVTSIGTNNVAGIGGQVIGASANSKINAVQSCSIDLPLSREVIDAIGSQLAYSKPLEFPIDVTLSISALVTAFGQGALEKALTGTAGNNSVNILVTLKSGSTEEMKFSLKKAVLDSQSFSQGLDDNETVDLTFSAQIGGATTTDQGLFFSALNGADPRPTAATNTVASPSSQPIS